MFIRLFIAAFVAFMGSSAFAEYRPLQPAPLEVKVIQGNGRYVVAQFPGVYERKAAFGPNEAFSITKAVKESIDAVCKGTCTEDHRGKLLESIKKQHPSLIGVRLN